MTVPHRSTAGLLAALAVFAAAPMARAAELPLGELPPQTLKAGQCALFLWARSSPPRRVFMALQSPAVARVQVGGRTVDLPRIASEGEPVFGHAPRQVYAAGGLQLTVTVEMDTRSGLTGGAVAPSATIEYRGADGWETVIPAAGMVGCKG